MIHFPSGAISAERTEGIRKLVQLVKNPDETLADFLSTEGIKWKFIPPRASSFGGLWEAAVKSVK